MSDLSLFRLEWSPRLLSILRMVAAALFMQQGFQKLFGFPGNPAGSPELLSLIGIAGILEFFGGFLLLIGLFTRPVAFLLSGQMAAAYFMVHASKSYWPMLNQGELAVLFCFVFLYLAAAGGGAWSLDRVRAIQRNPVKHPFREHAIAGHRL